jgi:cytoskeletal protein RodZ
MNEKHYKEKLSNFINHELPNDERQAVAEHLLQCAECRAEHDEIKLGAAFAGMIKQTDAPENLWYKIENALDGRRGKVSLFPNFAFFNLRSLAAAFLIVFGLTAIYFGVLRNNPAEIAKNELQNANIVMPQTVSTPNEFSANQTPAPATNAANQTLPSANSKTQIQPQTADSNIGVQPTQPKDVLPVQTNLPAWNVETLAGMPKAGNQTIAENGKLTVGEFLETDADSKAKIQVANIGNVEIAPNSRVKLVNTNRAEHRLALEKGALKAKILAPPRLFIVDTPSGAAVDLGCEYTLEVDAQGNSRLHVTSGFVALENGRFESIVPAGAIALTRKGKGVGTPFSEDASAAFQDALYKFDFAGGGSAALDAIIAESGLYDSVTLWHLLSRTPKAERARVFDALAAQIKPPANVTREGVLRLDKKMLDAWWTEIEAVWFE